MADTIYVVVQGNTLKDHHALKGADIEGSYLGVGTVVVIGEVAEGWGQLVGPPISQPNGLIQPDGTYLRYGKVAWFPMAHLAPVNAKEHEYRLITDAASGAIKSYMKIR